MSRMTHDGPPRSGRGFIVGRLTTPGRPASVRVSTARTALAGRPWKPLRAIIGGPPPYPSFFTTHLGSDLSRRSFATAETDCRRWRASIQSRS